MFCDSVPSYSTGVPLYHGAVSLYYGAVQSIHRSLERISNQYILFFKDIQKIFGLLKNKARILDTPLFFRIFVPLTNHKIYKDNPDLGIRITKKFPVNIWNLLIIAKQSKNFSLH